MAAADTARKAGKEEDARALTDTVTGLNGLAGVLNILQAADVPPTAVQLKAIAAARQTAAAALAKSKLP
jgi:hypothetical protein